MYALGLFRSTDSTPGGQGKAARSCVECITCGLVVAVVRVYCPGHADCGDSCGIGQSQGEATLQVEQKSSALGRQRLDPVSYYTILSIGGIGLLWIPVG